MERSQTACPERIASLYAQAWNVSEPKLQRELALILMLASRFEFKVNTTNELIRILVLPVLQKKPPQAVVLTICGGLFFWLNWLLIQPY